MLCGLTVFEVGNAEANKSLVLIFHNESTFHANEGQSRIWPEEGRVSIHPKTHGKRLMVGDSSLNLMEKD